jgi:hypothetical protein
VFIGRHLRLALLSALPNRRCSSSASSGDLLAKTEPIRKARGRAASSCSAACPSSPSRCCGSGGRCWCSLMAANGPNEKAIITRADRSRWMRKRRLSGVERPSDVEFSTSEEPVPSPPAAQHSTAPTPTEFACCSPVLLQHGDESKQKNSCCSSAFVCQSARLLAEQAVPTSFPLPSILCVRCFCFPSGTVNTEHGAVH